MNEVQGVIPYLVSPINSNGTVNTKVLDKLCKDLIAKGVHGLTPLGSTGEFAYLSRDQKTAVVECVVKATKKKVPVIAGVASTTTDEAICQAKEWEKLGCDGILAVLESYFPVDDEGVYSYFAAIAKAVSIPVVLYTNPNFQRTDLSIPVIKRLSAIDNIVGIKDASSNTGRLLSIMNACGDNISIYAASAHIPTCVMLVGGKGWYAGPACVAPTASVNLYNLCKAGDWKGAMEAQRSLWALNQAFAKYSLAACVKGGLVLQGYDVGEPLAPQKPLSEQGKIDVAAALKSIGEL